MLVHSGFHVYHTVHGSPNRGASSADGAIQYSEQVIHKHCALCDKFLQFGMMYASCFQKITAKKVV